ncbi:MAG: tRNA (adenosine(37)-N6)-threonylcarbamoyltransferase complex dimerization subunit type 1 TsaB [Proteobacteria bacterium]|nr:tRNA (adenosine(37)-N6)-threonylcarbamoyltransferase complex dimerization subunit type 1 TsaB [Pseudomonadota bacterium]
MNILAVDTALGACSVAVLSGDRILAHRFELMDRGHAERLAPMVEEAMGEAGLSFSALERLAVTTGPGTFTGQRVGLAFMRGLRVALKKPLVGITTLEAMCAAAMAQAQTQSAAALHDAKRGEVYFALVDSGNVVIEPSIALLDDAVAAIKARCPQALLALCDTAAQAAAPRFGGDAKMTAIRFPDALWVARLAQSRPAPQDVPKPLYLRAPDAKLPA